MRRTIQLCTILALISTVAPVARGQAPAAAPNPWVHVTRVDVNPAAIAEFEDYVKKIMAGRAKLGLPNAVQAWQTAMGGSTFHFDFVLPFTRWEEVDANPSIPAILAKAYGEAEGAKIMKAGRSAIQAAVVEVYRVRLDLSTNVKGNAPPANFATLTVTEHDRETLPDYMRMLGKIKKAEESEPNTPTVIRYVLNVGEGAVTIAARPHQTQAERMTFPNQPQLLTKVFGEGDAADMNALISKTIKKRSTVTLAFRADLSYPGK